MSLQAIKRLTVETQMYTLLWLSSACFLLLFFFLPETSSSNILFRRAARLRRAQQSGLVAKESKLISQAELDAEAMQTSDIVNMCLVHPFTLNFTEPMVFFLNLYTALIYGNNPRSSRPSHLADDFDNFKVFSISGSSLFQSCSQAYTTSASVRSVCPSWVSSLESSSWFHPSSSGSTSISSPNLMKPERQVFLSSLHATTH